MSSNEQRQQQQLNPLISFTNNECTEIVCKTLNCSVVKLMTMASSSSIVVKSSTAISSSFNIDDIVVTNFEIVSLDNGNGLLGEYYRLVINGLRVSA